jgi:hypothetical protein
MATMQEPGHELTAEHRSVLASLPRWARGLGFAIVWVGLHVLVAQWAYVRPIDDALLDLREARRAVGRPDGPQVALPGVPPWAPSKFDEATASRICEGLMNQWANARPWFYFSSLLGVGVAAMLTFPATPSRTLRRMGRGYRASQRWIVSNWRDD